MVAVAVGPGCHVAAGIGAAQTVGRAVAVGDGASRSMGKDEGEEWNFVRA